MKKLQGLADFYKEKWGWIPDNLQKGLGHFNVFSLENYIGDNALPVPYR